MSSNKYTIPNKRSNPENSPVKVVPTLPINQDDTNTLLTELNQRLYKMEQMIKKIDKRLFSVEDYLDKTFDTEGC